MSEQTDPKAPAQESAKNEPVKPETAPATKEAGKKDETPIGDIVEPKTPPAKKENEEEIVPLSALIEMKKANKDLTRQLKEANAAAKRGDTEEVDATLESIVEEFPDLDPKFLKKFKSLVRAEAKREAEAEIDERLKPLKEKDAKESFNQRFDKHFDAAMETMPEFKDIVDKETIKQLTLSPSNANKTLTKLIEDTFGKFVKGKSSIDAGKPGAGKDTDTEVDFDRAKNDPAYFKEVMKNPVLKKKYNEKLTDRVSKHM